MITVRASDVHVTFIAPYNYGNDIQHDIIIIILHIYIAEGICTAVR